jgi:hypothetical protein
MYMTDPSIHFMPRSAIVVAACADVAEANAMMRWLRPVLADWPARTWTAWIADASDSAGPRAALVGEERAPLRWRTVAGQPFQRHGETCRVLGGRAGLVILTHASIARVVIRQLDGLAAELLCMATSEAAGQPFQQEFAGFGITA